MVIDREQLKALRAATRGVALHSLWRNGELDTEGSRIVGYRRAADDSDYTCCIIRLPSALEYGGAILRTHPVVRAFAHVSSPQFNELWSTFLALVRSGDEVKLVWSANGHANCYVRDAGLCADDCDIEVLRPTTSRGRTVKRRLRFHIDSTICQPNSARMFTAGETGFGVITGPYAPSLGGEQE